jgi:hypothetical protein
MYYIVCPCWLLLSVWAQLVSQMFCLVGGWSSNSTFLFRLSKKTRTGKKKQTPKKAKKATFKRVRKLLTKRAMKGIDEYIILSLVHHALLPQSKGEHVQERRMHMNCECTLYSFTYFPLDYGVKQSTYTSDPLCLTL